MHRVLGSTRNAKLGMVAHTCNVSTGSQRKEDHKFRLTISYTKFKASLGYAKSSFNKTKNF